MRMILYSALTMAVIGAAASGCTTEERRTAGYGVGGAAIGGLAELPLEVTRVAR